MLLAPVRDLGDQPAVAVGERAHSYAELRGAAAAVAAALDGVQRAAVWATPSLETIVAVVGALAAGVEVVPLNPKLGTGELAHILADSAPEALLTGDASLTVEGAPTTIAVDASARADALPAGDGDPEGTALVVYTSGTTGAPKGALLSRRAIASNLDALAAAWAWTGDDRLVHGLPLFHVHGLVLGVLGPLRLGGQVHHLGRFDSAGAAAALRDGGTMLFGVPTMYHRLAADAESDPEIARALGGARLLVSGSAALPAVDFGRLERATGQQVVERYGMTETLMNTAVRADGERRPGSVGAPVDGVEVRLLDDDGGVLDVADDETIGEIAVRGPNLFSGYLNRPDATAEALHDGWFHTGDLATRASDGYLRIVGRRSTDLIKTGGYKVGAGEVEGALLEHPAVAEVAVTGEPDDDLGERIVAWIVPDGDAPTARELADHVAGLLTPHKRPRDVRFLGELPRNAMGKVVKARLRD
jgi:malonyl-CoA/methylmalonyl-CoA synthetase